MLPLFHLKSVMLDHFIATNATAHKVNSYCTVAISYCTFCVEKHAILGPVSTPDPAGGAYSAPTGPLAAFTIAS